MKLACVYRNNDCEFKASVSSFITEIAVYFMSNKEMSYLIMNMSLCGL